jgi:chaperonin GroEL (HSP60 family)
VRKNGTAARGLRSEPVSARKEKVQVATISANGNAEIGELGADAMEKVGTEGVIIIEEAKTTETALRSSRGCSSIAVTSRPTSSPTPRRCRPNSRQIAENSAVDGGVAVAEMRVSKGSVGLDAATKACVDLIEAGITDPAKVVRVAIEEGRIGRKYASAYGSHND